MRRVLPLLLLLWFVACKQASQSGIHSAISNNKTNEHINIPGTRLYMIPPVGAKVGKGFVGLELGEKSAMVVRDLEGGSYADNSTGFSKEGFEQKGLKVLDYKEIKINGYPAKFVAVQQGEELKGYAVLFGDQTFSTMVMTTYPINDDAMGKQILASLNSMYYDKNKKADPFDVALFSVDDTNSKFKFKELEGGLYMYTVGGVEYSQDVDSPFVLMAQMPTNDTLNLDDFAEIVISGAQQTGFNASEVKNDHWESINGHNAFEVEAYDEHDGQRSVLYLCIFEGNGNRIVVEGFAVKDVEANIEVFKKFARGVHLK
jgi:hypothetical protein